jgi:hypothetical protein
LRKPSPAPALLGLFGLFFCALSGAFGGGKAEAPPAEPLNQEWVLCLSALDVSSLPESRRILGDIVAASLAASLEAVDRRVRDAPEYAYYQEAARSKNRSEAAKKIAAKREERDQLLYRGEADWKYRRDLLAADEALAVLEEDYRKAAADLPRVFERPVFSLSAENKGGLFPAPPSPGGEYRFCADKKIDAFLAGEVSEYHNRIYLSLRLYTRYDRSYQFEDSVIFSPEDINAAMEELAGRLTASLSGMPPGAIRVRVQPEDAMVLINGSFASRGDLPPREHSPGALEVTVMAEGHASASVPLELSPGELSELYINLRPLALNSFTLTLPPELPGASIYRGSLYLGETPLRMTAPLDRHEYIQAEALSGEQGSVIIQGGDTLRDERTLTLTLAPPREDDEVSVYRRRFYGAWGRFQLALPLAMILRGISDAEVNAYNYKGNPALYDSANTKYYISLGATLTAGIFAVETLFHLFRYVYVSNKNATKLANGGKGK